MGTHAFPVTNQRMSTGALALVQNLIDRFWERAARMGATQASVCRCYRYGSISDLECEEGIEADLKDIFSLPLENLPKLLTDEGVSEAARILIKERLEGVEDLELKALTENWDAESWNEHLIEELDALLDEMGKLLCGMLPYPYWHEGQGEVQWAIEESHLYVASEAHMKLHDILGGPVVYEETFVEFG